MRKPLEKSGGFFAWSIKVLERPLRAQEGVRRL